MSGARQFRRLAQGGMIDRAKRLVFSFNGRALEGFAGDTLASALIANGVDVVARSFKLHRPRGVMTDGPEEPNAMVTVGEGPSRTPNLKATEIPLTQGLVATSQNCWPSVDHDLGAVTGLMSPLLGAGFYYKTFMAPQGAWTFYEKMIRRAAGLGRATEGQDPDTYEHRHAQCDVLIVGAGPAGLAAAQRLVGSGLRIMVCDERRVPGGALQTTSETIDGAPGAVWALAAAESIGSSGNATILQSATAVWLADHKLVTIAQRLDADSPVAQRLWFVRARHIIVATGAIERPICFSGNDRPGVMLSSAVGAYRHRYGVAVGSRAVVHANNDSGYNCLAELEAAGIDVAAMVDLRPDARIGDAARDLAGTIPIHADSRVAGTSGRKRVQHVAVASNGDGPPQRSFDADLLCVAGGWSPTVHLLAHRGTPAQFDPQAAAFLAQPSEDHLELAGSAAGLTELAACLESGFRTAENALAKLGLDVTARRVEQSVISAELPPGDLAGPWCSAQGPKKRRKAFVDLQNDVTAADLESAIAEGYDAVEHLKRYTTNGMGTDQGKLSNVLAIGIVAEITGRPIAEIGHTTFRPPYTPVTFGALVGPRVGSNLLVTRRTAFHSLHLAAGAIMEPAGAWLYPKCYPRGAEDIDAAIRREVLSVRGAVGFVDMATLGKFELHGPDVGTFLDRVYGNRLSTLAVGRCRYAVMLREDGVVFDDGTATRMAEDLWHVTATTSHAGSVYRHMTRLLQVEWPELDVHLVDVSEQWAGLAIAGPKARDVLAGIVSDVATEPDDLPFMGFRKGRVGLHDARIYRISFSGELAYEVFVGADGAADLWQAVMNAGEPFDICPYGYEALDVMRIEKGHVADGEIDGRNVPGDLGLGRMMKRDKPFLGSALLQHYAEPRKRQPMLVGLIAVDGKTRIPGGAVLIDRNAGSRKPIGHVTATVISPTLGKPIAMALLDSDSDQTSQSLSAVSPAAGVEVDVAVAAMPFFDPAGERMRS
jgi:heterotetrameric sarcosine oxidase alpha subunit